MDSLADKSALYIGVGGSVGSVESPAELRKRLAGELDLGRPEESSESNDPSDPSETTERKGMGKGNGKAPGASETVRFVRAKMSPIAVLLLESDVRIAVGQRSGDLRPVAQHESRLKLAAYLGVSSEDLEALVDEIESAMGENIWSLMILEERTRLALDSKALRASSWDRIEAVAIEKLGQLVQADRIRDPDKLLAIAKVANQAVRPGHGGTAAKSGEGGQVNVGINILGGEDNKLQTGDLGQITLTLSSRVRRQLERPKEATSILAESQMLDVKELREVAGGGNQTVEDVEFTSDVLPGVKGE